MTTNALHSIECQVSRRATTLNQAWTCAQVIRQLSLKRLPDHQGVALPDLRWLECEMVWICEDLEEAGAWACDLDVPLVLDPLLTKALCRQILEQVLQLPAVDCDCQTALIEAQVRSKACLMALAEEPAGSDHERLAAA